MCSRHYTRWRRHGDPTVNKRAARRYDELMEMIADPGDECIIWQTDQVMGYSSIWCPTRRRAIGGHVLALESVAPRPSPEVDALHGPCHNPACVSRRHLSWGTHQENMSHKVRDGSTDRG